MGTRVDERFSALGAIFGDRVPKSRDAAARMLDESALTPADPAERAALRALALDVAGARIEEARTDAALLAKHGKPAASSSKGMAAGVALQIAELARAQKAGGLAPTVSLERARALFTELANAPDIPHRFVDEGCHHRAQIEASRLEAAGVYSEKVFLVPTKSDLRIDSRWSPIGFTLAMFHTAPVINVDMPGGRGERSAQRAERAEGGRTDLLRRQPPLVERMVIDPSLFDEPVSVAKWSSAMRDISGAPCETLFLPRFAFHLSDRDDPPSAWREQDMADARQWNEDYQVVQKDMLESGFYEHLKGLVAQT